MRLIPDPIDWIDVAAGHSHRPFLKLPAGSHFSYAALLDQSGRIAAALIERGVEPGDRVAVQVDKSADAVFLYVACLRMGAVFVPINVANTPNEVEYFLCDSRPRLAVIRPQDQNLIEPSARRAQVDCIETLGADGGGSLLRRASTMAADFASPRTLRPDAIAAIIYTSGTTGRAKGAMLTRANLASNAAVLAEAWRFRPDDVLLHALPLFHIHGLFVAINTVLASMSSLLLLPKFDAAEALEYFPRSTVYMGVPTHYTRLLQQRKLDRDTTASLRLFVSGSAPLPADTHREFQQRTGHVILERYGMSETMMNTSNPYDGVRLPGSVGPPLQGTSMRVANAETGAVEEGPDVVGTLQVKGPNVFAGYWRAEEKTRAEFTSDGWFKTGDVGCIDRNGYVHIVGRAKDLVISGGYNVYPKEVESELDAVEGVLESAVFGVPHPDFGEGVTAVVVAKPGATLSEEAIIESVKPRLARYKVPKRILLVDELPRNSMGKVQKNALRKTFAAIYAA
ncbi:MAG TPA: AMP-binding protein [Steroidobacteraceae bacterium]|jgi:malonyl-CoA/methylmalonyl-CoA synthetase|nr:AMP-binding protein [Steroidobacteraceae bacterium]